MIIQHRMSPLGMTTIYQALDSDLDVDTTWLNYGSLRLSAEIEQK